MPASLEQIAEWLTSARHGVAFTGAGISTESGIPDFRSPNGVWARSQPVYFSDFLSRSSARYEYWRQKAESHRDFAIAQPNAGHRALAGWERSGLLRGVITQNIDGLHQLAGNRNVLELHGTAREISCLSCLRRWPADPLVQQFLETDQPPICTECGGWLKHATISFGQSLPADVLETSVEWAKEADLFLAIGSSLVVHPAASLPELAANSGARLVIINREPTPLDHLADAVIRDSIGDVLSAMADAAGTNAKEI